MKILYITRKFPPSIGGMQTQSIQFYESLSRNNEVLLISWGGSQIFLLLFVIYAFFKSIIILSAGRADIIQVGDMTLSPLGLLLKHMFKKPVLSVSHGRDSVYHSVLYDYFVIGSAKRLDRIVCVSNGIMEKLVRRGFRKEQLVVIPNGIDISTANIGRVRGDDIRLIKEKCGVDIGNRKVIFSASRLVPKKGVNKFIEQVLPMVTRKMSDALLLVAGDGPERSAILRTAGKAGLADKVFLLGNITHDSDLYRALFSVSDVFVMPNIRIADDFEGFGIVVLEAGLNGTPVVAYDVDGIKEALHDKQNGLLISEGCATDFANAVIGFLKDNNLRHDLSERAKEYVINNFNWNKISACYSEEYSRLIRGARI
jgi:glycosyltransferase involved in cell wall biosynthesis